MSNCVMIFYHNLTVYVISVLLFCELEDQESVFLPSHFMFTTTDPSMTVACPTCAQKVLLWKQ